MRYLPDRSKVLAAVMLLALGAPARAEVSAEVDAFGTYVRTLVVTTGSARRQKIWTPVRSRTTRLMLNPEGDTTGDLLPVVRESPLNREPWVVWSRGNGRGDFDLAWSRFHRGAWTPVTNLLPLDSSLADVEPVLVFNDIGRAHVAWWRSDGSAGRVYVSLFLDTRWMLPLMVSDLGEDARQPSIGILPDRRIQVTYTTPAGRVTKIVTPNAGTTITDDINPFNSFSVSTMND
jgi:hypothetical protein